MLESLEFQKLFKSIPIKNWKAQKRRYILLSNVTIDTFEIDMYQIKILDCSKIKNIFYVIAYFLQLKDH